MRRWLFNILAAVSLVLCVLVIALSARSYFICDDVNWRWGSVLAGISSKNGHIMLLYTPDVTVPGGSGWRSFGSDSATLSDHLPRWATNRFWPGGQLQAATIHSLTVPYWCLLVLLGILPFMWWRRRLCARRRIAMGLCLTCGYDLRASTDRCPECGTAIPPAASTEGAIA